MRIYFYWHSLCCTQRFFLVNFKNLVNSDIAFVVFLDKKNFGLTLAAARYSSEDAAQLVEYCQAVIDFTRKNKPYLNAKKVLHDLQDELEIIEAKNLERKKEEEIIKEDEVTHFFSWFCY